MAREDGRCRRLQDAGEKLLAACKDGVDLTGTPYEAKWLANGKVCDCDACKLAQGCHQRCRPADQEVHLDLRRRRLGIRHRLRRRGPRAGFRSRMSTSWCSTPRCTPTPADSPPSPPPPALSRSSRLPASAPSKKDLGMMAMSYGYVYVATVAMGANPRSAPEGSDRGRSLPWPVPGHRLRSLHQPWYQHGQEPG